MTGPFPLANAEHWRGSVCDGCGMPVTSCICTGTPWDTLNDGTSYGGPEVRLTLMAAQKIDTYWQRGPMPTEVIEDIKTRMMR